MQTIVISCFMSTLLLFVQPPVSAKSTTVPFISYTTTLTIAPNPGMIADFTGSLQNDRVLLNWVVTNNETADRLIIQRSKNGKKFEMVGLVFATDKTDSDNYQFYEQAGNKKSFYRIIIVRKDQSTEYSSTIRLQAGKSK